MLFAIKKSAPSAMSNQQNPNEANGQSIYATNPDLVAELFQPPIAPMEMYIPSQTNSMQNQDKSLSAKQQRALVLKQEMDQKIELAKQLALKRQLEKELADQKQFRENKERLLKGNETIIRDVDAIIMASDQEKQLFKEKQFIDYELNTFVPIHSRISEEVAKVAEQRVKARTHMALEYAKHSTKPGQSLDAINENEYNPYKLRGITVKAKISDPIDRGTKIKNAEDKIIHDIEVLAGKQEPKFAGMNNDLRQLERGDVTAKPPRRERKMMDPTQYGDITAFVQTSDTKRGKRMTPASFQKTTPISLDFDE